MIEKGRHKRPLVPREKRYCPFCLSTVESEIHFLTQCSAYKDRTELFDFIEREIPNFVNLDNKSQFIFLMPRKQTTKFEINSYNT